MKVLLAGLYPLFLGPHYATELEMAIQHIKKNDEVYLVTCNGELKRCIPNPNHLIERCQRCVEKRETALAAAGLTNIIQRVIPPQNIALNLEIPHFASIADLKKYIIDDIDIGMAVASSVVSELREPEPDMAQQRRRVVNTIQMAYQHKIAYDTIFNKLQPDIFYLFNGRFSCMRPLLRVAQQHKVEVYIHERGSNFNTYFLYPNTYPHDLTYAKQQIDLVWNQSRETEAEKARIAGEWYESRRNGHSSYGIDFIDKQLRGHLPDMDSNCINIGLFNSSEDEFVGIDGWDNLIYRDQNDALRQLVNETSWNSNLRFYLRVHPNLKNVKNSQTDFISKISSSNLTVIPADSPVSTYDLMDACDVVVSYGSTVGIESCYWGTPSILLGRAFYEAVGACLIPGSHDEFVHMINQKQYLEFDAPKAKLGAIKYGYYHATKGTPFEYFTQTDFLNIVRNDVVWEKNS